MTHEPVSGGVSGRRPACAALERSLYAVFNMLMAAWSNWVMIDELLTRNKQYAQTFPGPAPVTPALHIAVVACMDSRLDVHGALGLRVGDAHVMRNGGGVVTDDMIRSLVISQ